MTSLLQVVWMDGSLVERNSLNLYLCERIVWVECQNGSTARSSGAQRMLTQNSYMFALLIYQAPGHHQGFMSNVASLLLILYIYKQAMSGNAHKSTNSTLLTCTVVAHGRQCGRK